MGAMAVTRIKAEEFRRLAQECRATAQTLSTEQARAEMLAMADVCDRVAAQPTLGNDLSEAARPPARNQQLSST
jgi:pyruvate-formate lyase